jgi:hypothetical protein
MSHRQLTLIWFTMPRLYYSIFYKWWWGLHWIDTPSWDSHIFQIMNLIILWANKFFKQTSIYELLEWTCIFWKEFPMSYFIINDDLTLLLNVLVVKISWLFKYLIFKTIPTMKKKPYLNKVSSFKLFSKVAKHPKIPNSQKWHSLHSHTNFSHNGSVFRCFSFFTCLPTCFPFLFVWTLVASLKIGLWHYAWLSNRVSPKES